MIISKLRYFINTEDFVTRLIKIRNAITGGSGSIDENW